MANITVDTVEVWDTGDFTCNSSFLIQPPSLKINISVSSLTDSIDATHGQKNAPILLFSCFLLLLLLW